MRIIVTGVPGSGKTTLATALAEALRVRYLGKDVIKEALWDTLGPGDIAWSMQLGLAASVALLSLASEIDDVVIDHPVPSTYAADWRAVPDLVEVHCACPSVLARERYASRTRHPCHFDGDRIHAMDDWIADDAGRAPLGPRLEVDTSKSYDVSAITAWVAAPS